VFCQQLEKTGTGDKGKEGVEEEGEKVIKLVPPYKSPDSLSVPSS